MNRLQIFLALAALMLSGHVFSQESGAENKAPAEPEATDAGFSSALALFPKDKACEDVRMPRFKEDNTLDSLLHSEWLIRESDELLQLDGMTIVMFEPDESMSLRVKTKKGVFNFGRDLMKSRDKTFIESPQFDMEGDRLEFNTKSQKGTLNGNVTMVIYNVEKAAIPAVDGESSDEPADEGS